MKQAMGIRLVRAGVALFLALSSAYARDTEFPLLAGPYLGQEPPGRLGIIPQVHLVSASILFHILEKLGLLTGHHDCPSLYQIATANCSRCFSV